MSSYNAKLSGIDDAHVRPALMAWKRNAEWIASRTRSLPRNVNERLLMPPLIADAGTRLP